MPSLHYDLFRANTMLMACFFSCAPASAKVNCLSGSEFLDRFEPARITQKSDIRTTLNFPTENGTIYLNFFRVEDNVYRLEYKGKNAPVSFQFDRVLVNTPEPAGSGNKENRLLYDITVIFGFKSDGNIMNLIYADEPERGMFKDIQFETGKNPCGTDVGGR